ncbi:MAG: sigma-54 dependent transcriptional regulator [Pirellula sp.]|nr:sigma-54 dependent transcriptional regulator [Pirellula sp.]
MTHPEHSNAPTPVVWIVDDEPAICWSLRKAVESHGLRAQVFSNAENAIEALQSSPAQCDVLITDIRLPKKDGFSVAEACYQQREDVPIILMTAFGDLDTAVKAMRSKVFEYLVKPFDLKDALQAIDKAIAVRGTPSTPADFSLSIQESLLLGHSPGVQQLYRQIAIAAQSEQPVLIAGPEGAPLESVASAIHRHSSRSSQAFLSILPTTISLSALEREFVGSAMIDPLRESMKSAPLKTGLLGLVGEGTLFIEEVADLPRSVQLQLLRVLDHNCYLPFDSQQTLPFRGRVLVSSTRELSDLVEQGEFDPHLQRRLQVHRIDVPPLGSRREDAVDIALALAARCRANGLPISTDGKEWILEQEWKGDVRELRNTVEHAAVVSHGSLLNSEDLRKAATALRARQTPRAIADRQTEREVASAVKHWLTEYLSQHESSQGEGEFGMLYEDFLSVVEPPLLHELFHRLQFNRAATAAKLGMHRSTLRQKMRKYEID